LIPRPPENALPALLGLPEDSALLLDAADVSDWGTVLTLRGRADTGTAFSLMLTECREFQWRAFVPMNDRQTAPINAFTPGRDAHRSPLKILTDHFSLTVYYGAMSFSLVQE
jgi:hypothetical protein